MIAVCLSVLLLPALVVGAPPQVPPARAQEQQGRAAQGEIAFLAAATVLGAGTYHVAAVRADRTTRHVTPVVEDRTHDTPAWSPDGRWLAYSDVGGRTRRIVVVSSDGSGAQVLGEATSPPVWTPDARHVVFTHSTAGSAAVSAVEVLDGGTGPVAGEGRTYPLPRAAGAVAVSPDGSTLVFTMTRDRYSPVSRSGDLWRMGIDGSGLRPVSRGVNVWTRPGRTFAWSPDGAQIAFLAQHRLYGDVTAHIVGADGSDLRPLGYSGTNNAVAWAPHGEFLVVTGGRGAAVVSPDGELLGRLPIGYMSALGPPAFAPDATAVYMTARGERGGWSVHRFPLDGTEPEAITGGDVYANGAITIADPEHVAPVMVVPPGPPDPPAPPPPPRYFEPPPQRRTALEHACPAAEMPWSRFVDVARSAHRRAIDCVTWWDIAPGVTGRRFAPTAPITRADMAGLLAELARVGGRPLPATADDAFDDDNASPHEPAINRLAAAGIVSGVASRRFQPAGTLQRDQMAAFVVRTYDYIRGFALPDATTDYFTDDPTSVHEAAINKAAKAQLVAGVTSSRYDPSGLERRETAATRAARVLDALVEEPWAHPPREGLVRIGTVTDGDTILADRLDDTTDERVRIRLIGIQAMERGHCNAADGAYNLHYLIGQRTVRLSSGSAESIGRDDRPLRFVNVYDQQNERWIDASDEMLRRGVALWFPSTKEPGNNDRYRRALRTGIHTGKYLWNNDRCGAGPQQAARLRMSLQWDAPGPDHTNLNGEWVRITNAGTTAVNVSGWKVRTAFLRPPHVFGARTIIPGGKTLTLRVGSGRDSRLVKHWDATRPMFRNVQVGRPNQAGDGAYLLDPDGDIRAHVLYP